MTTGDRIQRAAEELKGHIKHGVDALMGNAHSDTAGQQVATRDGMRGTVVRSAPANDGRAQVLVAFDGTQVLIPADLLVAQPDGSYQVALNRADIMQYAGAGNAGNADIDQRVLPVIEEVLHVGTRQVARGTVRVHKMVHEHIETVDQPLIHEAVQVERVAINRVLDAPAEVRYDGDTMVIPIVEEVLVVEKRLMLREEVRITTHQTTVHQPQQVTLRREELIVDRVPGDAALATNSTHNNAAHDSAHA